jgi:hypothetical protein
MACAGGEEGGAGPPQDMTENKKEGQREEEWAKERAGRRTPEERTRNEEEPDALH